MDKDLAKMTLGKLDNLIQKNESGLLSNTIYKHKCIIIKKHSPKT